MQHADQPAVTGVALCHKKLLRPMIYFVQLLFSKLGHIFWACAKKFYGILRLEGQWLQLAAVFVMFKWSRSTENAGL
jgi:hypothetical protein